MSPLDAARRLATTDDRQVRSRYDGCTECVFCLVKEDRGHAADCPLLGLPRIVAALEAAEAVVDMQFSAWCAHADTINDLAEVLKGDA